MKKTSFLTTIALLLCLTAESQIFTPTRKIICYFTNPVDTTVAEGQNKAVSLIRSAGDTVMDYINRAKYSIDICLFDYVGDSNWYEGGYVPPIYQAINNAYNRGVKIRWICDNIGDTTGTNGFCSALTPNYGLDSINKSIPVVQSPTGGNYTIMHNKFMVIDGESSNPNDAIVWTGSMNWEPGQIDKDQNNIVIIQDSGVAHAYETEFDQMWGDTVLGGAPDPANEKFGPYKKDLGRHTFLVGADNIPVEVYFSPEDTVNNHILSTMKLAQHEIDVSMYTFTENDDAEQMVTEQNSDHIYVSCLMDNSSEGYDPYNTLTAGNGLDTLFELYIEGTQTIPPCTDDVPKAIDHNKYMIIDPCDWEWNENFQSSSLVFTGSHNWSSSANTSNDENVVIIHNTAIANLFYQSYLETFVLSETDNPPFQLTQHCIGGLGVNEVQEPGDISIYPNPADKQLSVTVSGQLPVASCQYKIYNIMGQMVLSGTLNLSEAHTTGQIDVSSFPPGVFMLVVQSQNSRYTKKFCKE